MYLSGLDGFQNLPIRGDGFLEVSVPVGDITLQEGFLGRLSQGLDSDGNQEEQKAMAGQAGGGHGVGYRM
jgi:hypothetical protein